MKQALLSIIATVYLFSSAGAAVHFHYCMDKLVNSSLINDNSDECGKCGMTKGESCCKDKTLFVKNPVDQNIHQHDNGVRILAANFDFNAELKIAGNRISRPISYFHQPPPVPVGLYLFNCVFRI